MSDVSDFSAVMAERGWEYGSLEELCEDHMRLFIESYQVLQLCEQFRAMMTCVLEALAKQRAADGQGEERFPWDYTRGYPLAGDLS